MCLRPGTELVFEKDIEWGWPLFRFFEKRQATGRLVRFRQVNLGWPDTHHDAVEFPNPRLGKNSIGCWSDRNLFCDRAG